MTSPVTSTHRSAPVDGFALEYDLVDGPDDVPAVVLLHGWPGDRQDFRRVLPLLAGRARLVVPDLRGFGGSDAHPLPPAEAYSAAAQGASVLGLLDELGLQDEPGLDGLGAGGVVLAGYDIGSRLLQQPALVARACALVLTPPLPGAGERLLAPAAQSEFWYQNLHRLPLADALLDGRPEAVRAYLGHLWSHWSGPGFALPGADLERLLALYSRPGAFTASIAWYRSRAGSVASAKGEQPPATADRVPVPVEVLWPEHDPLFPPAWSDRLDGWYADLALTPVPGCGHFVPLEAPGAFAAAVLRALDRALS